MYYITIWTGSHTSAAHHNRSTYMPGISYKTFMLLTTLDHSTSVQIPEHTDKWQYTKVQSKIQLSTGTQIAKKDIPQTGVHTNCKGTYISFLQFLPLVALSWARSLFLPLNVSKTTQNCNASGLETLDWSTAEEKKKTKMPLENQPTRLKRIAIVKKSRWFAFKTLSECFPTHPA